MKEPNELTERDFETLRKVESLLASPHSVSANTDDVSVLLANTVPQADDAFRRQLDAQLMEKLEKKQAQSSPQKGRAPSQIAEPPVVLTQPVRGPVRMFNRITGGLGSALVAAMLVAALALATIFLWQSQRNVSPADKNGTPISILDPAPADDCGEGWIVNNSYQDVLPNSLSAVAVTAIGPNDVWVVGDMTDGNESLMVTAHWDGVMWDVISIPESGTLNAVAAVSPDDVWAVGGSKTFHWDGTKWNAVPIPAPEGMGAVTATNLYGVAAVSANDVWAVGSYPINRREHLEVILHWDGVKWSAVETPNPSESGNLSAVTAISTDNVWAVGSTGISSPGASLSPLIMHWDGVKWSVVESSSAAGRGVLTAVAAISANDIWAVGRTGRGAGPNQCLILHWDGNQWSVVPGANVSGLSCSLLSVAAVAPNDIWAVGSTTGTDTSMAVVMRWNGTAWREFPLPALQQIGNFQSLAGVAASPSGDIWAVGRGSTSTGASPLVLRYGKLPCPTTTPSIVAPPGLECGPRWTVSISPDLIAGDNNLKAVAAISPNDVWAVGQTAWAGALAMHWEGNQWSVIPTPDKVRALRAVAGVASNDVWAVGDGDALHWDGTKWNIVPMPTPEGSEGHSLYGIEAIAANDVWAVGYHAKSGAGSLPLIEHWDGTQWRVIPNPAPNIEWAKVMQLRAVSAVSRDDVWAVGDYFDGGSTSGLLIMHWDGKQWSLSHTPQELNGSLLGVAAVSANDVWAVGVASNKAPDSDSGQTLALILHWDGKQWSVLPEPNIPGEKYLSGVAAVSANDVWAVGTSHNVENGGGITLHWDGKQWSTLDEDKLATFLAGVAALPSGEVWAAGGGIGDSGRTGPIVLRYGYAPCVTRVPTRAPTAIPTFPTSSTPTINVNLPSPTGGTATTVTSTPNISASPTSARDCTPGWKVVHSPNPSISEEFGMNGLNAVAALAPDNVWAIGEFNPTSERSPEGEHNASGALTIHWDGTQWKLVSDQNSSGLAIAAIAPDDIWTLRGYNNTAHWDGTRWNPVQVTEPVGAVLQGLAAVKSNDVWAVGYSHTKSALFESNGTRTLIERWDGRQWHVIPSPNAAPEVVTSTNELKAAVAISANDVWAVGNHSDSNGQLRTLIVHWDGKEWKIVPSPSMDGHNRLYAIAAVSTNDVWAVGSYGKHGSERTLVLHWDGAQWRVVRSPDVGTASVLMGITAVSANDIWAVGYSSSSSGPDTPPLILHWDGSRWDLVPTTSPKGTLYNSLHAIAALPSGEVWAVGWANTSTGANKALVLRYTKGLCQTPTAATPSAP